MPEVLLYLHDLISIKLKLIKLNQNNTTAIREEAETNLGNKACDLL